MDSLIETLKNLGAGRLAVMILTFFGLVIFFIFIAVRSGTSSMTLLYADLSVSDSTEVTAKLDVVNIPYRLSDDGKQILVPPKDVGRARMLLAQEGLPHQGSIGYEIFDKKQTFGMTSFQENINQLRALEGELSRTIGTIENIRSARVHLVLPQRELFSHESQPASASVFINLRTSAGLQQEQIQAIQHLVAAAVSQLKPGNIAVIDQNGNLLARGDDEGDAGGISSAKSTDEMRQKYEMRLSRSIEGMVGRIVGYGRVRANVTADLNFDVISKNTESYNPEGQVVRSTQTVNEDSSDSEGTNNGSSVSVENNLPGLGGGGSTGAAGSKNNRTEEVTNYEIGKTIENMVQGSGKVEKLSIAVLVDGRYETDTEAKKPEGVKDEDWQAPKKYIPRTQDELDKIKALVRSAVGYDEGRGDTVEVVNMQFADADTSSAPIKDDSKLMGFNKADILGAAQTLALSIVAVLVILLVLRPLAVHIAQAATARRSETSGMSAQEETALLAGGGAQGQLAPPSGDGGGELESMMDMGAVEGKVKASSVQKISELVTNHPAETVSVIRQWMSQES